MGSHISLLGSGIDVAADITPATLQCLKSADIVYALHSDPDIIQFFRSVSREVIDCHQYYEARSNSGARDLVYRDIADAVLSSAIDNQHVAFIVHGSPLVLVSATEYVISRARAAGIRCRAIPAVSSIDAIACALEIDPFYDVRICDATTLLSKRQIDTSSDLLIFQLATTQTNQIVASKDGLADLRPLSDYLLKQYGSRHIGKIVHIGTNLLTNNIVEKVRISSLHSEIPPDILRLRPTLYVPSI